LKSDVLIVLVLLAFAMLLPVAAQANDSLSADDDLFLQTIAPVQLSMSLDNQSPYNLLNQLVTRGVTYQLDPLSVLKFSCNVASLSGTELAQDYEQDHELYASAAPDIQIELVVRF
jgi:hypothetical protein